MDGMNSFLLFILPCVYSLSYIYTYIYSVLCYVMLIHSGNKQRCNIELSVACIVLYLCSLVLM